MQYISGILLKCYFLLTGGRSVWTGIDNVTFGNLRVMRGRNPVVGQRIIHVLRIYWIIFLIPNTVFFCKKVSEELQYKERDWIEMLLPYKTKTQRICHPINKLGTSVERKKSTRNYWKGSLSYLINKEERFSSFSHSVINKLRHSFSDFTEILCPRFLQIIIQYTKKKKKNQHFRSGVILYKIK